MSQLLSNEEMMTTQAFNTLAGLECPCLCHLATPTSQDYASKLVDEVTGEWKEKCTDCQGTGRRWRELSEWCPGRWDSPERLTRSCTLDLTCFCHSSGRIPKQHDRLEAVMKVAQRIFVGDEAVNFWEIVMAQAFYRKEDPLAAAIAVLGQIDNSKEKHGN